MADISLTPELASSTSKTNTTLSKMTDPRSILLRSSSLFVLFLSGIFLIAGLIVYAATGIGQNSPSDDMGGPYDLNEFMMLSFLALSLLTNLFFISKAWKSPDKPLHFGYYIGFDLFVCLALMAIWATGMGISRFLLTTGARHCDGSYSTGTFFCHPKWRVARGLFVTGYAFAMLLTVHHGLLFAFAARRLDVETRAKKRELRAGIVVVEDEEQLCGEK